MTVNETASIPFYLVHPSAPLSFPSLVNGDHYYHYLLLTLPPPLLRTCSVEGAVSSAEAVPSPSSDDSLQMMVAQADAETDPVTATEAGEWKRQGKILQIEDAVSLHVALDP
mmetsp:Transcript_6721/g.10931  ORF Transcript_6721/g.10931 Transcript_6721/m.10931 type:complete len:112 (+) Transcript_6721:52-387(+)